MSRTIVVTGGAGFVGTHLCEKLLRQGQSQSCEVVCVDNFLTGRPDNIRHLLAEPRYALMRHDITQPLVGQLPGDVAEVYNLACPASPTHYQRHPIDTVKACVVGMLNVLELAERTGAKVVQASTSEVYGDPQVHPQSEGYWGHVNCTGPRACYDEGKRVAETLCMDMRRQGRADVRIARLFNTYGPRMSPDDGRVVSNFVVQALSGAPLTVHGDGRQTRSFCYVDDLVDGLIALMRHPGPVEPLNLGNPEEVAIGALARRIVEMTGGHARVVNMPLPQDDPTRRCPDIARARQLLHWAPAITLDEGLRRTIAYYQRSLPHVRGVAAAQWASPSEAREA